MEEELLEALYEIDDSKEWEDIVEEIIEEN